MRVNHVAVAHEHRALDHVLQFAHVARPVVRRQHVDRRRRDAADVVAVLRREPLQEVVGQQQDVGFPLAQRRNEDRETRSGGRTDPRGTCPARWPAPGPCWSRRSSRTLTLTVSVPPSRSNSRSCSTRSSFTCVARCTSPISSRNSVPPSRQLEASLLPVLRAGERALFVAEQLRLDQRIGQRRAADLDERLLGAQRVVVDRVGDQLLARAGFAAQRARSCSCARPARLLRTPAAWGRCCR